jgi:Serine acetyltransferase
MIQRMYSLEENYYALKKCVISDYPYPIDWDDNIMFEHYSIVYNRIISEHSKIKSSYYSNDSNGILRINFLDHYVILTYRLSHFLYKLNMIELAEAVYYSTRLRGNIDLFYTTEIDSFFIPTHALGTIVDSHVKYGKLFRIYDNVHIGPYSFLGKKPEEWVHPIFGDYVTLLASSKVYGKCVIGNNVIVSSGTTIINEEIPDNCIVMGNSPNLYFMPLKIDNSSLLTL